MNSAVIPGHTVRALVAVGCMGIASSACSAAQQTNAATAAGRTAIAIDTVPVLLNPQDPSQTAIGNFVFAGGLQLTASASNRLHELSDMVVSDDGRFVAVGDDGVFVDGQIVLDGANRLVGVTDVHLAPIYGMDGKPIPTSEERDAEGLAVLPDGDRLVSFERKHRIWLYPAAGGPPRAVASPEPNFPSNAGLEALAVDPATGPDAYLVGVEASGETWSCRVSLPRCTKSVTVELSDGFALVAMDQLSGGLTAYLLRAFDEKRGARVKLRIQRRETVVDEMTLAAPQTVDNYEALGIVERTGNVRFYLASDDNGSNQQRTLMLAFDWKPR